MGRRPDGAPVTRMPQEDNRRQEPRAPIELKVEYKRLNTFFQDYTKNISRGGTFIKTRKPLPVGTEFIFKLVLPVLPEPLELHGEVRWVVREGEPPPPGVPEGHDEGMGIRFNYGGDEERLAVSRKVEKLMVDSLGPLLYSRLMSTDAG